MAITPNKKQEKAIKLAKEWWDDRKRRENEVFVIAGYAGTGKTTCLELVIDEIGLDKEEVITVAFTGMASSCLTRKGHIASTIHKLIYNPKVLPNGKVKFNLKECIEGGYKLAVVDEASQASKQLMDDLLSFHIPVIAMGDPLQTKQFGGLDNGLLDKPNIVLDEVMRTSLDNPILYLATQVRNGERIKYGKMGDNVFIIPKNKIPDSAYVNASQVITTTNNSVSMINNYVRKKIYGLESMYPYKNEKIMCLKNNWDKFITEDSIDQYLVNGLIGTITDIGNYSEKTESFKMSFKPIHSNKKEFKKLNADALYFSNNLRNDDIFFSEDPEIQEIFGQTIINRQIALDTIGTVIDKFNFAYATTVYKAQGSEFDSVLYYKDRFRNTQREDYTSITRSKEFLMIGM